ncbi:MAG: 2-hydroxyacid dehydrogenase [Planctomycetes bacterium]|nr:2-hydroxyacid dehydrogenase [Planctomycetota bacterium]
MRVLAIADAFIPAPVMDAGFAAFRRAGHDVTVREWPHADIEALQTDNLLIEQQGANALQLPDDLVQDIADYDMLVVQFAPVGTALIERAARLKYIGVLRAGLENVDSAAAAARNVTVIPTPGRNARAVAEFTVGLILGEIKNIARSHAAMKQGVFRKEYVNTGQVPELLDKTVGLVGLGHIGGLVAKFLQPFGCRVLVHDPFLTDLPAGLERAERLDDLLASSDIVSLHMRLTDQTKNLIGAAELAKMKPAAYLINSARSGLIDESALVQALENRSIMGAALDVFDSEPLPAGHPFLTLDNVTLTPHMAGTTRDAFANTPKLFCERFLAKAVL